MKPTPPEPTAATITADQLAHLSNLSKRRVYQLAEEQKIPPAQNGHFPMIEAIRALFSYYQQDERTKMGTERTRLLTAQADLAELRRGQMRKELVPADAADMALADIIIRTRNSFLEIPRRVCSGLEGKPSEEIFARLRTEIEAVLHDLANEKVSEAELVRNAKTFADEKRKFKNEIHP